MLSQARVFNRLRSPPIGLTCDLLEWWDKPGFRNCRFFSRSRSQRPNRNAVRNGLSLVRPMAPPERLGAERNRGSRPRQQGKKHAHQQIEHIERTPLSLPKTQMFREDWIKLRKESSSDSKRKTLQAKKPEKQRHEVNRKLNPQELSASFPPNTLDAFISCLPGLEPYLAEELKSLGHNCTVDAGGVYLKGNLTKEDILDCHLHLGIASHVLIRWGEPFTARGLPELKRKIALLPWHQFLLPGTPIQVRTTSKKSKLNHKTAIRSALIDGINESFNKHLGPGKVASSSPAVYHATQESTNALQLTVRVDHDEVRISIDTSATPLHRRGYRLETGKAPLREDLAYSMIFSAGYRPDMKGDKFGHHYGRLLDPFCGSGTIAIEAASIAAGLLPGRLRPAPFNGTVLYDDKKWRQRVGKAQGKVAKKKSMHHNHQKPIAASDRNQGAVEIAKANAKRAGVQDWIDIQCLPMSAHPWLDTNGTQDEAAAPLLIATNPPFGMRIAADRKRKANPLLPMYQTLVERQRKMVKAGNSVSAITLLQDPRVFRKTGAPVLIKFSSQHGGIPVAAAFVNLEGEGEDYDNKQHSIP